MFVIGHRGSPLQAPENTIPSFLKAIEAGVDFIELDVHSSKDGSLVVIHDGRVDRTTDSRGFVSDFTVEDLKALDAGGWFSREFKGVRIPTLEDVLALAKGRTSAVVEIKEAGLEKRTLKALRSFRMIDESMVIAPLGVCRNIRMLEPRTLIQADLYPERGFKEAVDRLMENLVNVASIHVKNLKPYFVKFCHKRGLLVNVWPVNNIEGVRKCIRAYVDFITTDNPHLVIEALHKEGYR
jgi:glycerophosphoryl diester phosphodiesterase